MNRLKNDWLLYLLLVPVLAWYLIFCYAPMGGLVLAFKDYSFKLGIWDSPWIGLGNFTKMLSDRMAGRVMCQICCRRLAPSMLADSYWSCSTLVMAAR